MCVRVHVRGQLVYAIQLSRSNTKIIKQNVHLSQAVKRNDFNLVIKFECIEFPIDESIHMKRARAIKLIYPTK